MNQDPIDMTTLCAKVCSEFKLQGFKIDTDPRSLKESYNIQKQASGQWFKIIKASLHDAPSLVLLDMVLMPSLFELTEIINKLDPEINKKGGRVFITPDLVYKIKRGSETALFVEMNKNDNVDAKFHKLCEEIKAQNLVADRYRVQETYLAIKSPSGEWSVTLGHDNHSTTKVTLDLKVMPLFKTLATKLNQLDPQLKANGGRIFITPTRVYRIKNKIELDYRL